MDQEGITNIVATSLVYVMVEGRNHWIYMDFMVPFGYSKMFSCMAILDLEMRLMAHSFVLLRDICQQD